MSKKKKKKEVKIMGQNTTFIISKHFFDRWTERVDKTYEGDIEGFKEAFNSCLSRGYLSHISGDYFLFKDILLVASRVDDGRVLLLTVLGSINVCENVYGIIRKYGSIYFKKILREYGNLYLGPEAPKGEIRFAYV